MISTQKAQKICKKRINRCEKLMEGGQDSECFEKIKEYWIQVWDYIDDLVILLGTENFNPTMTIVRLCEACTVLDDLGEQEFTDQIRQMKLLETARLS